MKNRFSTLDLMAVLAELKKLTGMRVHQVYDIDNKTYLFRLNRQQEEKVTLLMESGVRIHTTEFDWPKNPVPSGFTMKLRKHLKNKRLESISQLGVDRIVDLQFGINEATYHVILELYDRGNIVLTDCEYTILNILRPRASDSEDVKFVVRETYPVAAARQPSPLLNEEGLQAILQGAKEGDNLRKILVSHLVYGPSLIEHVLLEAGMPRNAGYSTAPTFLPTLCSALHCADGFVEQAHKLCKGYIIQKKEAAPAIQEDGPSEVTTNLEFHPFLFCQHIQAPRVEYDSFDRAIDNYFSNVESQKIDIKALQKEKEAWKKLDNIKQDHFKRIDALQKTQAEDVSKAELIETNLPLVERALLVVRSAVANQISWSEIKDLIKDARARGDPVASAIKELKLETNHFSLLLCDPFASIASSESRQDVEAEQKRKCQVVDIDLDLSAYANARKYYDMKRHAAKKEQKTMESSEKAYKNAEKKTKQALKEVAVTSNITKARKTFWFEKFLWFISSENYLVIAGRDIQQNELIVKRYMRPGDLYVHADLHGASSIVIKNPSKNPVPPKTLNEAGTMAMCYSAAWDAKVVTSAWWVFHHQVSKTAPTGEYLTPGSFMIRGKKNYLPPSHLVMGFSFLFKVDEDSLERHLDERKIRVDEDVGSLAESLSDMTVDEEIHLDDEEEASDDQMDAMDCKGLNGENDNHIASPELDLHGSEEDVNYDTKEIPEETSIPKFPDTIVKLPIGVTPVDAGNGNITEDTIVYLGDNKPVILHPSAKKQKPQKQKCLPQVTMPKPQAEEALQEKVQQPKRGQKSKLKKIKEKYKDQDEEERKLRMEILASAGLNKQEKAKKSKEKQGAQPGKSGTRDGNKNKNNPLQEAAKHGKYGETQTKVATSTATVDFNQELKPEVDDDVDEDDSQLKDDEALLASLTGCPLPEDGILFAVPMCAPYSSLQSFKFKVKVIPGTGRRGKAAKAALQMFLRDRSATPRERDVLRSVKDQDISRNLPGKVKLTAPNIVRHK